MSDSENSCYEVDRLELLLSDKLSERDESKVLRHLNDCWECQRVLETVAADSKLWNALPRQLTSHVSHQVSDAAEETATFEHRDVQFDLLKKYLGPTDHPEMLGRIGSYEVCGLIGQGSTGIVVKALEARLNRYVAIKILAPAFASNGSARRRFEREARAVAAVSHEHVVPIFAVDEFRGIPYIVMQYVPGSSLNQRVEQAGPLDTCQVVRIGLQVARGLAAAHEQGIVHRDIKPANVLLENSVDRVLVTDFGLARVADEAAMTRSGTIAGTPQFMSPEQAMGENIDHRSDLFSLGSTMYTACTGRPPFRADTVFGVIQRVCECQARPIRETNPEIADWLEAMISKLMSKRREDRFDSASQVAEVLSHELAHLQNPSSVHIPDRTWRVTDTSQRRVGSRAKFSLIGLAAVATMVAAVTLLTNGVAAPQTAARQSNALVLATQQVEPERSPRQVVAPEPEFEMAEERVFPAKAGGQLVIRADSGHIEVNTSDELQVKVVLKRKVTAQDEQEAQKTAAKHKVTFTPGDGNLSIEAKMDPELKKLSRSPFRDIKFQVTIPRNYNPDLTTAGGHISIKDPLTGKVRVKSAGGHLTLANVDGPVWANTSGGHVTVKDINGRAEVHTRGGNLTIGRVSDAITAETSGGNIKIAGVEGTVQAKTAGGNVVATLLKQPQHDCHLVTSGGNVRVRLAKGLALNVEAETSVGRVSAPFANGNKRRGKLKAKLEGGGPVLKAKTSAGNVVFEYIDAS